MRGFARRHQSQSSQESAQSRWLLRTLIVALTGAAYLVIAACGSPSTPQLNLPGGTYTNTTYGFHVTYPRNWKANPSPATSNPSAAIPFNLVITRTGDSHSAASLVSTCTITVMNLKNSDIAKGAANLASNKTLQAVAIGGVSGYKSQPLVQDVANSDISVTHTDYYVVHGNYEYQISTDSVKGDNADTDLESIVNSFAFAG